MGAKCIFRAARAIRIRWLLPALLFLLANSSQCLAETPAPHDPICPDGYRLHYQGFCINIQDELSDTLGGQVRGTEPIPYSPSTPGGKEPIGYKFSNMADGEFCKNAYVNLSRGLVAKPAAMALGDQSCGVSSAISTSTPAAKIEALKKCRAVTSKCRIIFPEDSN